MFSLAFACRISELGTRFFLRFALALWTGRTGQAEHNGQNKTGRIQAEYRQNRTGRTGQAEQDRQNRTGRTG